MDEPEVPPHQVPPPGAPASEPAAEQPASAPGAAAAPAVAPASAPAPPSEEALRLAVHRSLVRWTVSLLVAIATAVVLVAWVPRFLAPDLARGKPWRASSKLVDCDPEKLMCGGRRTAIFFHTLEENQPWVEIDLGAPTRFTKVKVHNQRDGEQFVLDRAVPLVLEVGDDQRTWRVLAQQNEPFSVWTANLEPTTARYVRLRSPRLTYLHLEAVQVFR